MANRIRHQIAAGVAVGSAYLCAEADRQNMSAKPLLGAGLAAALTNLPDLLEPASHPNHRQFFHSLAFAGLVGAAGYKAYKWETDNSFDGAIRFVVMVGAGAYLVHLLLDAGTSKSLPIIGTL